MGLKRAGCQVRIRRVFMKAAEQVGFSNPKDVRNAKTAVSAIVLLVNQVPGRCRSQDFKRILPIECRNLVLFICVRDSVECNCANCGTRRPYR